MTYTEPYVGKRRQVSFMEEATFGTAVAATKWIGLDCIVTEKYNPNLIDIHGAGTDTLYVETRVMGKKVIGLGFEYIPQDGKFLQFIASTITSVGTSIIVHTFNFLNLISSFSCEIADRHTTNIVRQYGGCYVKTLELVFSEGEPVKVRMDCGAQDYGGDAIVQTTTALTSEPFMFHSVKWTYNSEVEAQVKSGSLKFINKLTEPFYCAQTIGNKVSEPILEERFCELSVTLQFSNSTFLDLITTDPVVKAAAGVHTLEFIKDSTDDKLVFTLTDLWSSNYVISNKYEDTLTQDITFKLKSIAVDATDTLTW